MNQVRGTHSEGLEKTVPQTHRPKRDAQENANSEKGREQPREIVVRTRRTIPHHGVFQWLVKYQAHDDDKASCSGYYYVQVIVGEDPPEQS